MALSIVYQSIIFHRLTEGYFTLTTGLYLNDGKARYNCTMDKRYAHHLWTRIRPIKPWYFLALTVFFAILSAYSLRNNYTHMVRLREQVYAADKAGQGVNEALQDLRGFVGHHMNTNLTTGDTSVYPPIQLKYTYDRLIQAKSQQTSDYNAQIYTKAQKYCESKIPSGFSGRYRIACIQRYVTSHNASATYISPDMYKFDFYSPRWSPDLAGGSIVLGIVSFAGFLVALLIRTVVRRSAA
jgi:hypothetical protein